MVEVFKDVHEFLVKKGGELLTAGDAIKSTNVTNTNTLKEELIELPHQFFSIANPDKTIFNLQSFKTIPWWMIGEILTEFLNFNPPVMAKYRNDLIDQSYKLMADGTIEYMYGSRWKEHNQIENVRKKLISNPNSKRAIIQTWMPYDTELTREDVPCNVNYMFLGRDGKLDMTATIRSNDICRGSKYDYFLAGFMQQSMAALTNQKVGNLYLSINSLHTYSKDRSTLEAAVQQAQQNSNKSISINLPEHIDVLQYWNDLRHVKKAEESSYNSAFQYCDKHINDIHTPIFKDFARIIGINNAITSKNRDYKHKFIDDIQNDDVRRLLNGS